MKNEIDIDDILINPTKNIKTTIFNFCLSINKQIPCFCYHDKLSIAGNCRICMVEMNNNLVVSCTTPLVGGSIIKTNNKRVRKARSFIIEFLLVNHPLDCPICDQGGECDLQDIALRFGTSKGRFYEPYKRAISNYLNLGPFIRTVMTRCIHCTRCVRFLKNITGTSELGMLGRGFWMEVGTYVNNVYLLNELSANIIDLCPVGALTSMPYTFKARPWELNTYESIDIMDAIASSIRIDIFNNNVVRILPYFNEIRNEEWITNKARFLYDSFLSSYKLLEPQMRYYYQEYIDYFIKISWEKAMKKILNKLYYNKYDISFILTGPFFDIKGGVFLKSFFNSIGCSNYNYQSNYKITFDFRFTYLLNITIINLEYILINFIFNLNLRLESPILNTKIRKSYLKDKEKFLAISIGNSIDYLTFPIINLGNSILTFISLFEGKHLFWRFLFTLTLNILPKKLLNVNEQLNFISFLGENLISRIEGEFYYKNIFYFFHKILKINLNSKIYNNPNIISNNLGRITNLELGILPGINDNNFNKNNNKLNSYNKKFIYLCGIDNFDFLNTINLKEESFIVYQGNFSGWEFIYKFVDIILPSKLYIEQETYYLNIEGNFFKLPQIFKSPLKKSFPDYLIFKGLSFFKNLKFLNNFSIITNYYCFFYFFFNISCLFFSNNLYMNYIEKNKKNNNNIYKLHNQKNYFYLLNNNYYKQRFFISILNSKIINFYQGSDQFTKHSKQLSLAANKLNICSFGTNLYLYNKYLW